MEELGNALAAYSTLDEALDFLEKLSESISRHDPKGINIMTIHGSKGLEFDTVYLLGAIEGQLPHQQSLTES